MLFMSFELDISGYLAMSNLKLFIKKPFPEPFPNI